MLFYRTVARQFTVFFLTVSRNEAFEKARKVKENLYLKKKVLIFNRKTVKKIGWKLSKKSFFFSESLNFQTSKNSNTEPPILYNTPFTMSNFTFDLYRYFFFFFLNLKLVHFLKVFYFRWAVCCVTTRINMIPSETDKTKDGDVKLVFLKLYFRNLFSQFVYFILKFQIPALIPVLDMANHEFVNEIIDEAVAFNTESDMAEVRKLKRIICLKDWDEFNFGNDI